MKRAVAKAQAADANVTRDRVTIDQAAKAVATQGSNVSA